MGIAWPIVAAGAGAVLLGNAVLPAVGGGLKLLTKNMIKAGLIAYSTGQKMYGSAKAMLDEAAKSIESVASEAKAELKSEEVNQAMPEEKAKPKPARPKRKAPAKSGTPSE